MVGGEGGGGYDTKYENSDYIMLEITFISKANGVYEGIYSFRVGIYLRKRSEISSCIIKL